MKKYKVAILGATGAVGREMMKVLAERDFPVEELHLLASERSAGQKLQWKGQDLTVEPACDEAFRGMDIVLGAAENDIAKKFAPAIVKAGAISVMNHNPTIRATSPMMKVLITLPLVYGSIIGKR